MDEKTKEKKEFNIYRVSYIGRDSSFLIGREDLSFEYYGKPLKEFICFDFTQMNGLSLNEKVVSILGRIVYSAFRDPEEERAKFRIQENNVCLVVYTQCQIDDVVLFFVWHFQTQVVTESRDAWEARYGLVPGACCLKNSSTLSSLDSRQELKVNSDRLADVENKQCQFKNQYVACYPTVFPHFVNPENPKAVEFLKNYPLNIPVNMGLTFGPLKDTPDFCYGSEKPGLCTSLYDSILFDNTSFVVKNHNMEKLFLDAITTCFIYQNAIKPVNGDVPNIQHSLIGVSVYFKTK